MHSRLTSLLVIATCALSSGCGADERVLLQAPGCLVFTGAGSVPESRGVRARAGECLVNADGAVAPGAHGAATPEEAIRAAGFGRFALARRTDLPEDGLTHYREIDGREVVGGYGLVQVEDGTWVVHSYNASTAQPEKYFIEP